MRAHTHRVGVDAWLAILTEFALAVQTVGLAGEDPSELSSAAATEASDLRLAPSDGLRQWVRMLSGRSDEVARDELPSVVLPERVAARIPSGSLPEAVRCAAARPDDALALECERAAAARGLTLEAWVVRQAKGRGTSA